MPKGIEVIEPGHVGVNLGEVAEGSVYEQWTGIYSRAGTTTAGSVTNWDGWGHRVEIWATARTAPIGPSRPRAAPARSTCRGQPRLARLGQHSHDLLPGRKAASGPDRVPPRQWLADRGLQITTPSGNLDASIESNSHIVGLHGYRYYDERQARDTGAAGQRPRGVRASETSFRPPTRRCSGPGRTLMAPAHNGEKTVFSTVMEVAYCGGMTALRLRLAWM